ncbi:MAG: amino acid permease [Victivallales bacterium]|nr:amino acid permease [Victivallales bacterium]
MKKYLSTFTAWGLSFGYAVGWGAFVMPATSFLPGAGPVGTVIGIFLGGLVMSVIAWNYHKLVVRHQCSGGAFNFVQDAFGPDYGFLVAWFLLLAYLAILWANATALVLIARHTVGGLLQFGFHYQVADFDVYFGEALPSALAIAAVGILCLFSKRLAARVNFALIAALSLGLAGLFVLGLTRLHGDFHCFVPAFSPFFKKNAFVQTIGVLGMMPWAFVGFEAISNSSAEFSFSPHKTFWVMFGAILASSLAYAMLALLPTLSMPDGCADWSDYIAKYRDLGGYDELPTLAATHRLLGPAGIMVFSVFMLAATLTGVIAAFIALSRLLRGLATERILPPWFGELNADGTPRNAIYTIIAASFLVPFLGRSAVGWPVDVSSIGVAFAYCLCSASVFKFALSKRNVPSMVTGFAGGFLSILFFIVRLLPHYQAGANLAAESYLLLALWCILGFVFYRHIFKHSRERFGHSIVVWLGVVVLIFFSSFMWSYLKMQEAIQHTGGNITRFYEERRKGMEGFQLEATQVEREANFMSEQMEQLNSELLEYDLGQILLLVLTLALIFSLYRTQQYREKALEVARAKAEDSNKAKSAFLSNMSHDIRTPMNAIIGYTELAKRKGVTEANLRGYLKKIEASSHHLLALVNDVLEMSRIESGKMELEPTPINLKGVMGEVKDMFATQMSVKKIDFAVDVSKVRSACVLCDRNRLNRVLLNLISNAYKFTPVGGRISISVVQTGESGHTAGNYEFHVKDTGIGISPAFAAKVFDAFEREQNSTVNEIQGTGLGMAITKSIVDLMKGTISVETEQGKGTEFTVHLTLPYAEEVEETAAPSAEASSEVLQDFTSRRVLLVDDNEINRDIATAVLTEVGFEVDPAENGQIAVERIAQGGVGFYDIILMDVQMPVMNGYEATRAIRGMNIPGLSDIPIIALSANAFESDVRDAISSGMNAHVAKPLRIPELMSKLSELLANRPLKKRPPLAQERRTGRSAMLMNKPLSPQALLEMLRGIGCDIDETLTKTFMGNEKFYLKMFVKLTANTALERIHQALEAKNAEALFEASHELKGVYANLGLTPLYEPCAAIVEIARAGETEGVAEILEQLDELHSEVVSLAQSQETSIREA